MPVILLSSYKAGNSAAVFWLNEETGRVDLCLEPVNAEGKYTAPSFVDDFPAQARVRFDSWTGSYGAGVTMRNSGTMSRFRFCRQDAVAGKNAVLTVLRDDRGLELRHRLSWHGDEEVFYSETGFFNGSGEPVVLEMLESFCISGICGGGGDLFVHRFRSSWSAEARHCADSLCDLGLERSYTGHGIRCERFGQIGSMPVRGFHPFVALEDRKNGVWRGAQLAWAGSWQMEVYAKTGDGCAVCGGLADREYGHWARKIAPGETFTSPPAFLAVSSGGFDSLCEKLLLAQKRALNVPETEDDLPIIFNEWCTSWGKPDEKEIVSIADRLKGTPVRYLVIDAGWFAPSDSHWNQSQGDWVVNRDLFPSGIAAAAAEIRKRGLIPGIWYEMETACMDSRAWEEQKEHMLRIDGEVFQNSRRFWNLCDPAAVEYLEEHVVRALKRNGFGYVKIDYNETLPYGCDHPDSPGEGLRRQIEGVYDMFGRLREENPGLVIESCSSGGHRLEPSIFARTSMSSFSDAHEEPEIPVICGGLHHLMLPRQNQIWAVVRSSQTPRRLHYVLSSAMLGRMCLSGDITGISGQQWDIVCTAMDFYRRLVPVLKDGRSRVGQHIAPEWRNLKGWQEVVRTSSDGAMCAVYCHAFGECPRSVAVTLPEPGKWRIVSAFADPSAVCEAVDGSLCIRGVEEFSGTVVLLARE